MATSGSRVSRFSASDAAKSVNRLISNQIDHPAQLLVKYPLRCSKTLNIVNNLMQAGTLLLLGEIGAEYLQLCYKLTFDEVITIRLF